MCFNDYNVNIRYYFLTTKYRVKKVPLFFRGTFNLINNSYPLTFVVHLLNLFHSQ